MPSYTNLSSGAPARRLARRIALLAGLAALLAVLPAQLGDAAAPVPQQAYSSGGWTTNGQVDAGTVARGATVRITVSVSAPASTRALVDLELYSATARPFTRYWDSQSFRAGRARQFSVDWVVPADEPLGLHTVKVGVFGTGWNGLWHWNNDAVTFNVTESTTTTTAPTTTAPAPTTTTPAPTTTTTAPPTTAPAPTTTAPAPTTTTTAPPTTTTPPTTTVPPTGKFTTLPPGSVLPSGAECATRVRRAPEVRPDNASYNQTTWSSQPGISFPLGARADGKFTGTTDELIQWVACKWGIDEDVVRAQVAKESWWHQNARGDWTNNTSACGPTLRGTNPCPESVGLVQVRYLYHTPAFDGSLVSSAYNLDYSYSVWRDCYEGNATWLNQFERGRDYAGGDVWGCVGLWFAGRWYTAPANQYIADVQSYLSQRIWEQPSFVNG